MSAISYNRARQGVIDNWMAAADRLGACPADEELELLMAVCPFPDSPEAQWIDGLRTGLMLGEMLQGGGRAKLGFDNVVEILRMHGFEIDEH